MQILESSMFGLRTARLVFRSQRSPAAITLFPMIHVGEERFYVETFEDAFEHDVVLVEGIRSSVGRNLTRSYRWINLHKLGLTLQPRVSSLEAGASRVLHADLSTDEFNHEWSKVAWLQRALFALLVPLFGLKQRLFASRESLAKRASLEDRQSADEVLAWSPKFEAVYHSVIHARDARLLEVLGAELDIAATGKGIAIVYGARHMRAVIRELTRRGFHCGESKWVTVFKT